MNILDLILLLGLVGGVFLSFVRGIATQGLGLLSLYVSLLVGVWSHRLLGRAFKGLFPGLTWPAADILGFVFVLFLLLNGLGFLVRDYTRDAEWVKKVPPLVNQTGGLLLGFFSTAFLLGLAGTALDVITEVPWFGAEGMHQFVAEMVDNSFMVDVFRYAFRLGLYTIYPFVPGGLPDIFVTPI